ncbi:uncharacterized protein BN584_00458 [Clostridium sp. CAG:277]|nr:uncharacterized protein BN584_00458 [Clostridium sp. CAG:277]
MKQRKRGIRRMFAGAMAALMMLSTVDVNGWGVMNAKAEESAVEKAPQNLSIKDENAEFRYIILNGELQDDGVSGNANTLYAGTNWYYDREKNQLVLQNASVQHITVEGGDLTVLLSGENTLSGEIKFNVDGGSNTLEINGGNDNGSLIGKGEITVGTGDDSTNNLKISGATTETVDIECNGDLTIEKSHIVACVDGYQSVLSGNTVSIKDSYVKAKCTEDTANPISSQNGITISGSQILVETGKAFGEKYVIQNVDSSNSVITKKWIDSDVAVTKTSVYGTAALKEALTIASGESIEFESGASITNPEKLALADGASLFVNGEEHIHNKDGDVTYTWKDDKEHIKNVACKDCPIGYVTKEMEPHSIGENGFCACDNVCQPAVLTTNKYDIDGDSTKDTVYEISNAGQLYWFAGLVNGTLDGVKQNTSANAILTANITANENLLDSLQYDAEGNVSNGSDFISWTPIADCMGDIIGYSGTFDGNNKTVSGLYFNGNSPRIGLFGSSEADSNIKNVGVVDSYFKGNEFVGGVCGRNEGTITNCYNTGNLTAIDPTAAIGGICGINDNGGTIANCYNTGTVTATGSTASVGGVCGSSLAPISNCYNIGTVTATSSGADISSICGFNFGPVTNCYYLADTEDENGSKTAAQFANGEVDYLLSQGCSTGEGDNTVTYDGSIWGQTIGTDTYPTLGGAKVYKNATYNGCEGKPGEPVSYEYSNTEKNTYGDHPDTDNDGKCDDCGQYIDGIGAKLAGYSLSLTGNIGVNFYMELSNDIVNDESAYMNFILPNGTTSKVYVSGTHEDGSTATTDTTVKNGVTYYVFTCEVAAKEMTSDIQAQMIGNNGEKKGTVYTYTVKEYADYILSHMSADESLTSRATIQLVKGMLNYGGAAQKYFGYKTDKLASDGLDLTEPVFDDTSIISFIKGEENKASITYYSDSDKVTFKSAYLSLNSTTDLCVSVQFAEDVTVQEDMFEILFDSKEISKDQYEITKVNKENCYKITLHGIKASQLQKQYEFEVALPDTGPAVLKYGATSYAYTVMSSACDNINNIESLREVVKALSAYGSCAQGYEYYKNKN